MNLFILLMLCYLLGVRLNYCYKINKWYYQILISYLSMLIIFIMHDLLITSVVFLLLQGLLILILKFIRKCQINPIVYLGYFVGLSLAMVFGLYYFLGDLNQIGQKFVDTFSDEFMKIVFAFVMCSLPASHLVKTIFTTIFPKPEVEEENPNIGAFIGVLERFIILLLGLLNLYSSIALVLTAKSIARFRQLENKDFAEKYLVGTLISIIISLIFLLFIIA